MAILKPEDIQRTVSAWYGHIGAKGGRKRTPAQQEARRRAAAKARAGRAEKRRLGQSK